MVSTVNKDSSSTGREDTWARGADSASGKYVARKHLRSGAEVSDEEERMRA